MSEILNTSEIDSPHQQLHVHMFSSPKLRLVYELCYFCTTHHTHSTHTTHHTYKKVCCKIICKMRLFLLVFFQTVTVAAVKCILMDAVTHCLRVQAMVWEGWCICIWSRRRTSHVMLCVTMALMVVAFASRRKSSHWRQCTSTR